MMSSFRYSFYFAMVFLLHLLANGLGAKAVTETARIGHSGSGIHVSDGNLVFGNTHRGVLATPLTDEAFSKTIHGKKRSFSRHSVVGISRNSAFAIVAKKVVPDDPEDSTESTEELSVVDSSGNSKWSNSLKTLAPDLVLLTSDTAAVSTGYFSGISQGRHGTFLLAFDHLGNTTFTYPDASAFRSGISSVNAKYDPVLSPAGKYLVATFFKRKMLGHGQTTETVIFDVTERFKIVRTSGTFWIYAISDEGIVSAQKFGSHELPISDLHFSKLP